MLEYDASRMVKARSASGTFPITFTRMVEPITETSARVNALIEGDASGVYRLATPLLRRMVQRSIDADYARLKQLLESNSR